MMAHENSRQDQAKIKAITLMFKTKIMMIDTFQNVSTETNVYRALYQQISAWVIHHSH